MAGIPTPEEVEEWSEILTTPPGGDGGGDDQPDLVDHGLAATLNGHVRADDCDQHVADRQQIIERSNLGTVMRKNETDRNQRAISGMPISEAGSGTDNPHDGGG
jgi:hypothetical protein